MNRSLATRRRVLTTTTAAITLLFVAACGSDAQSGASGSDPGAMVSSGGPAATAELPDRITIAYQNIPNGDLVVKHQGLLETAFGPDVDIEWKLFDSGGAVNEAILAGAVDIGLVGSSPASRGLSVGIEYQVPWIHDVIGKAEALVVRPEFDSIDDLRGATIATPFASTSHYSLLAALDGAGLSDADVTVIDAEPDAIYAAWQTGDIDGAYVWNPNLAKLIDEGGSVLITSEDLARTGKTTYDLAVVTNEFAAAYPTAVQTWVGVQDAAVRIIRDTPDIAAAAIAAELNISEEDAAQQLSELIFHTAAEQAGPELLGGGLAANLFAAAQFNERLGKIDATRLEADYQKAVVTTFAAAVK